MTMGQRLAVVLAAGVLLVGCGESPLAPTQRVTEQFRGELTIGDRQTRTFVVAEDGLVNALLQNVSGQTGFQQATVGLGIGTWDGATCALVVQNTAASFNTAINGSALAGNWCLQIWDVGLMTETVNFAVNFLHP